MGERIKEYREEVEEDLSSSFETAMKDLPDFDNFQATQRDKLVNDESVILEPKIWDSEESNRQFKEQTEHNIALYDKFDFDHMSQEELDELLEGESTPTPTLDSISLINNVIWINQRKLQLIDLSEKDKKSIQQNIDEAIEAKSLHEQGAGYREQLEQELGYYNLDLDERTNDKWRQIHGLMTDEEKQKACLEDSTYESASSFAKTILERVDAQTIDKIIAIKQTGDRKALVEEVAWRLAFLTQFDNQVPVIEYEETNNIDGDACHNYLGYGIDKIVLNKKLLTDAYDLDYIIMTVAHEMMHAYQNAIVRSADVTDKKAQEYEYNFANYYSYTNQGDYDEYLNYHNQLLEIEAFCFGEQFRDLTLFREQYLREQSQPKDILDKVKRFIGSHKRKL